MLTSCYMCSFYVFFVDKVQDLKVVASGTDINKTSFYPTETAVCIANGFPMPSYKWIRLTDNETVTNNYAWSWPNGSESTKFQCIARNTVRGQDYYIYSAAITFNASKLLITLKAFFLKYFAFCNKLQSACNRVALCCVFSIL